MSAPGFVDRYAAAKEDAGGERIVLMRAGDFYEILGEDAVTAGRVLGIAVTRLGDGSAAPMCGIPAHALASYVTLLGDAGHLVAIS